MERLDSILAKAMLECSPPALFPLVIEVGRSGALEHACRDMRFVSPAADSDMAPNNLAGMLRYSVALCTAHSNYGRRSGAVVGRDVAVVQMAFAAGRPAQLGVRNPAGENLAGTARDEDLPSVKAVEGLHASSHRNVLAFGSLQAVENEDRKRAAVNKNETYCTWLMKPPSIHHNLFLLS